MLVTLTDAVLDRLGAYLVWGLAAATFAVMLAPLGSWLWRRVSDFWRD